MAATNIFQDVLRTIQASNLNYKMEISHFSATIHLKNSLLTDVNGNPLNPSPPSSNFRQLELENQKLARKIHDQEAVIKSLQQSYVNAVDECEEIHETNRNLEIKAEVLHSKLDAAEQVLHESSVKKETTENPTKDAKEILELTSRNETLNKLTISLHSQLTDSKEKAKKELCDARKELREEIKSWRKDLGEETKKNIKLQKKLDDLEKKEHVDEDEEKVEKPAVSSIGGSTSLMFQEEDSRTVCTICAEPIDCYIPKYFLGLEINPACQDCQDSSLSSDLEDYDEDEPFT